MGPPSSLLFLTVDGEKVEGRHGRGRKERTKDGKQGEIEELVLLNARRWFIITVNNDFIAKAEQIRPALFALHEKSKDGQLKESKTKALKLQHFVLTAALEGKKNTRQKVRHWYEQDWTNPGTRMKWGPLQSHSLPLLSVDWIVVLELYSFKVLWHMVERYKNVSIQQNNFVFSSHILIPYQKLVATSPSVPSKTWEGYAGSS